MTELVNPCRTAKLGLKETAQLGLGDGPSNGNGLLDANQQIPLRLEIACLEYGLSGRGLDVPCSCEFEWRSPEVEVHHRLKRIGFKVHSAFRGAAYSLKRRIPVRIKQLLKVAIYSMRL